MDALKIYIKVLESLGEGWTFYTPYWYKKNAGERFYYVNSNTGEAYEFDMPMFVRGKAIGSAKLLREDWLNEFTTHYRECLPIYEEGIKISYDPVWQEIEYTSFRGINREDECGYGYMELSGSKRLKDFIGD